VLPYVDLFLPSVDELCVVLSTERNLRNMSQDLPETLSELASWSLDAGAVIAGIKAGREGFYVKSTDHNRLKSRLGMGGEILESWTDREAMSPCYVANVAGTTGSGDATIAGFLFAVTGGLSFEDSLNSACAVGACSVETRDAVSGVLSWQIMQDRIRSGWPKLLVSVGKEDWIWNEDSGLLERVK
jgi:sugar/nucleoside kinase (ribokinase family)